jgi:pyrimidine operon attenuation protein / uracil phosphoribosyltransferase
MPEVFDDKAINKIINKLAQEVIEDISSLEQLVIVGILKGGKQLADRIALRIKKEEGLNIPVGYLDITVYRDDIFKGKIKPVGASHIPFDVNDKIVLLVDDVLFSGRTVRAALDGLNDFGRPELIKLGVMIDRGNRELPIEANYIGKQIPTTKKAQVTVQLTENTKHDQVLITE